MDVATVVARAAEAVIGQTDLAAVAEATAEQALALGAQAAMVYLADEHAGRLTLVAHRNVADEARVRLAEVSMHASASSVVCAARERQVQVIGDVADEHGSHERAAQSDAGSCVAAPLLARGRLVGVLWWALPHPHEFTPSELQAVGALGGVFAHALEAAQQRARREEWTAMIAHDLRQPVSTIALYARLLARHADAPRAAGHIVAATQRLDRMIADLLDISQIEQRRLRLCPELTDLPALVAAVIERAEHDAAGAPVAELTVRGEIPLLPIDAARMEQALRNLISNAVKYGAPGGRVALTLERRGDQVELAVQNDGGIAAEELPRLFEKYRRGRRRSVDRVPGLGLGLYITRGVVEAHGGTIAAESHRAQATTFRIALPVPRALERADARSAAAAGSGA